MQLSKHYPLSGRATRACSGTFLAYLLGLGVSANMLSPRTFAQETAVVSPAQDLDPQPGKQVERTFKTSDGAIVSYLLYLPKNYDGKTPMPFLLFLHGRGESYGPVSLVAKWGPPRFAARGDELPMILLSPQCPGDDSWNRPTQQKRLNELLEYALQNLAIDEDRVYLSGLSMGGFGTWRLAADHPEKFAAVIPVCGGGDPKDAEKLKRLPIWVFHGDNDRAVPFNLSVEMVEAIQKAGGQKIRFTSLEHVGHNSWSPAYALPELFEWMLGQKRSVTESGNKGTENNN